MNHPCRKTKLHSKRQALVVRPCVFSLVKETFTKSNIELRVRLMCMMQSELRQAYFSTLQLCAMALRNNASCLLGYH